MRQEELNAWIGRGETRRDVAAAAPLNGMAAALDCGLPEFAVGDAVPPLWHWTYFHPVAATADLGEDGHPKKGGLLPPVPLPRRMWAGSRLAFIAPIRVGDRLTRRTTVAAATLKEGRSGPLAFVVLRHELTTGETEKSETEKSGTTALIEEQDVVYRPAAPPGRSAGGKGPAASYGDAPPVPVWARLVRPSPALLFRYSALTFNSHRIHYDRPYAEKTEGYGGLVVHGPLIATLLADLLRREAPETRLRRFSFRAAAPLLDVDDVLLCGAPEWGAPERNGSKRGGCAGDAFGAGGTVRLWAQDGEGRLATSATAEVERIGDDRPAAENQGPENQSPENQSPENQSPENQNAENQNAENGRATSGREGVLM